jgi:hypothetical protein
MKWFIFYSVIVMLSCNTGSMMHPNALIEGVYTATGENLYWKLDDTLQLTNTGNGNGIYRITRHSGSTMVSGGKQYPKKLSTENWIMQYDIDRQILFELKGDKLLLWNSGDGTILWNGIKYKRTDQLNSNNGTRANKQGR